MSFVRFVSFVFPCGIFLAPGVSGAQEDRPQANTSHIRKYSDLPQLTSKASSLAEAGRYVEALSIYEEALKKEPDTVVPLDPAESRAVGLWDYVLAQVSAWPEEGKAAYRRSADPLAEHRFQGAKRTRDEDALELLIEEYPLSAVVKDALGLIGNLRLDAGEYERAAAALERLLPLETDAARAVTMARLGLAWSRSGRKAKVEELAARAAQDHPDAAVRIADREVNLAKHLRAMADGTREGKPPPQLLALPAWEMTGGGRSGSELAEPGLELAKLAWADAINLPRFEADEDIPFRRGMTMGPTAEFRPFFPSVSDGIVYVQNGLGVSAYNLFGRQAERLWHFRVPPPSGEVMFDNRTIYATSVHEGRVFANLVTAVGGAEDQLGYVRVKFPFARRALFALDAYTGKALWKVGGQLARDAIEENATFSTAPTPDGGRLYIGAIKQKLPTDPFQHYVLCLDAATGRILWSRFVASGGTEINLFGNSTRESMGSPVSVTEDSVYYCTNHGAIAALEKKSGRLRWIYRYRQIPVMPTRSVYVTKSRLEWVTSPPVVAEGLVAVTPADSQRLYVFDAGTGEPRWERPRGSQVRVMYGARNGTLVLGGERLELYDLRTGESTIPPLSDDIGGTGRGAVAEDGIYMPCRDKMRKIRWDGSWDEIASRRWPGGIGEGGNLIVVDGSMVLASQDGIQVYFDRRDQEQSIRAALDRDPDNVGLLYRGAIRYLQSGSSDHAAALLVRAVERTSKSNRPEDERLHRAARKRLFSVSMEAGRADLEAGKPEQSVQRFQAARKYAADVPAKVEASLHLARVRMVLKEDAQAVGEYQRLILDHGDEMIESTAVFDLARNAIAAILSAMGRAPYEDFERAARTLLGEARRSGTADALQKVFRLYPNSRAAEEALFEIAGVQQRLGRPDDQLAALRLFVRECPESARGPEAHAALVRALEEKGHTASARTLLRRMIRQFPDAEIPEGEGKTKAGEWAERRLQAAIYARPAGAAPLPKLAPPLATRVDFLEKRFPEGAPARILGTPPKSAERLVFVQYSGAEGAALKAYDLTTQREAWEFPLKAPIRFASFLDEALLVADENVIVKLDPRNGATPEWKYASRTWMRGFALIGQLLLHIAPDPRNETIQQIVAVDALRGVVAWTQKLEGHASRVHPAGDLAVVVTEAPNQIRAFEADTGKRLLEGVPYAGRTPQVVHVADDLIVLHSEGRLLEAYDLPAGTVRWKSSLERITLRGIEARPEELVLLGEEPRGGRASFFLMAISLRSGKITRRKDGADVGDPRFMIIDGSRAVVVSRGPAQDRAVEVRGISLGDFSVAWKTGLEGKEATLLPPTLTADHLVVGMIEEGPAQKYGYAASLLDKQGRVVQNIRSAFEFERPPTYGVANDRVMFSVGPKVEVYR